MKYVLVVSFFLLSSALFAQHFEFTKLFSSDMKEGVSCYRIPALITAINGDLIAVIDERVPSCADLKWSNDINIVMRRSRDNGKTWSPIETVIDFPLGKSASDPSLILDRQTGELFLFFNYMDLENEKDIYYLMLSKSQNNGKSWSAPEDITKQISKPDWYHNFKFITSGRGIQMANGDLIHSLVNLEHGLHLFKSIDHGKSWQLMDTALRPGDESKVVQLSDGSLMVNSRVNGLGKRFVHRSKNEGKNWISTVDEQLIDPSCNASILRYKHGEHDLLLFSNANSADARKNLSIRYSTDNGKTWSKGKTIYEGSAAYSSMTILKNGEIGLFFEKDDYKENVFIHIPIKFLLDH